MRAEINAVITEMSRHEDLLQSLRAVTVKAAPVWSLQTRQTQQRCGPFIVNERDGQSLNAFEANLVVELSCLLLELKEKRYQAQPVRRVAIAKDDGGERLLSIPTVRDRVVQQALRSILEPLFEPDFHPSSYGYRPGRSGHHAIGKAELFIRRYRREWVVNANEGCWT